ncbi:MAG: hypothetical protein AAF657_01880 [Acidobacteriota bacterium]
MHVEAAGREDDRGPRQTGLGVAPRWLWLSALVIWAVGTACFAFVFHLSDGFLFRHDGTGYFLYAHSLVTDFDSEVTDDYRALNAFVPEGSPAMSGLRTRREPDPRHVDLPWPMGSGLVMAPFYAVGLVLEHAVAAIGGREPQPFGILPQYFFGLGSLAYGWLGLWATFLCCRRITGVRSAGAATLAALLGGPVVFYTFFHPSMAHASSFGLVALFIWLWWRRWAGEPVKIVWLGLLIGLLVTVRYQNAIFGLLLATLLLYEAYRKTLPVAIRSGVVASLAFLAPVSLQVAHLAMVQDEAATRQHWQTEDLTLGRNLMDPSSPFFFATLFSCRHGAIYWAPLIGVGLLGLFAAGRGAGWARLFVLVFVANVYLVGCLRGPPELMTSLDAPPSLEETNWSGGHAFGMRYFTECAPLVAVGLAALLGRFRTGVGRRVLAMVVSLGVLWNGLLLLAYGMGTIDRVGCVTHTEMARGALTAVQRLAGGG